MEIDINELVHIKFQKNGKPKLSNNYLNEVYLYELLRSLGFCSGTVAGKRTFYRRIGANIFPSAFIHIRDEFINLLRKDIFINLPKGVERKDILNWFIGAMPIKKNRLLYETLKDTLTKEEEHILLISTDKGYKHRYEQKQLLNKLKDWDFSETMDTAGSFSNDCPLFYKEVQKGKYIVFNRYNVKDKNNDGFDCWLADFKNEKDIGNVKSLSSKQVKLSFKLETDIHLIQEYLN